MSAFLDTTMIVRYLTDDPPAMARRAAEIIDHEPLLQITDVVLAETAHVLRSVYQVPREAIIDRLIALVGKQNIAPFGLDKAIVVQGLSLCRPSGRVSVADAMVWAAARQAGSATVYTFDERFPSDEITVAQ